MADAIFISYRRDDSEGEAGRLFDDLVRAFGNDAVFMDVAGIKPGVDFRKAIEDNVASCGVLLAIVGPSWASIAGPDGRRRLEDPNDFVALEIASALNRDVPVIPVLVHDAKMPAADLLPESLKSFAFHNSVELSHARWNSDVKLLEDALKSYVKPVSETPVHATVPVQLPPPHHPSGSEIEAAAKKSKLPVRAGVAVGVVVAIALSVYFATRSKTTTVDATYTRTPDARSVSVSSATVPVAATVVPVPTPKVAAQPGTPTPPEGFTGTWVDAKALAGNDLNKIVISASGATLAMHGYGACVPRICDWGIQPLQFDDHQNGSATFALDMPSLGRSRVAKVTIHPVQNSLDVLIQNAITDASGTRQVQRHQVFTPQTPD